MKSEKKSFKKWKDKWDERIEVLSLVDRQWSWNDIVAEFERRGVRKARKKSWWKEEPKARSQVRII